MDAGIASRVRYKIFDPTGNVTALVESDVEVGRQPEVAARIMDRHAEVEQVGFVKVADGDVQGELRMAGGEFCGNATMSAAAWRVLCPDDALAGGADGAQTVWMRVSGAALPVEVRLRSAGADAFEGAVHMPQTQGVEDVELSFGELAGTVPVVRMEGISHAVIEPDSVFFCLRDERDHAEQAVRSWCAELGTDGLGLMFFERGDDASVLTPLVYIPGGDTVFWENSCASGSAAVAMCAAARCGRPVSLALVEPGGTLHAESDPASGETWLRGAVRLTGAYEL